MKPIEHREIFAGNPAETSRVARILGQPANRTHLTGCPTTGDEVRDLALRPDIRLRVAIQDDDVVGVVTLGEPTTSDYVPTWVKYWAVDADRHGNGIGRSILKSAVDWAFENPTPQGDERKKLCAGVIQGLPGSDKVNHLFQSVGFRNVGIFIDQVRVGDGRRYHDVIDYELVR